MTDSDKKHLSDRLSKTVLMAVATYGQNHPWIATVYYVHDDDLNLYFISPPSSQHSQDIKKNNKVAVAIAQSNQLMPDPKEGIQIYGTVKQVSKVSTIKWMLKMFHKVNPGAEDVLNYDNMKNKVISSKVYKITPIKIKTFNQQPGGDEIYKEYKL